MKTIIAAAAALFAANVSAVEIYHGFADGNSDVTTQHVSANDFTGAQPSIGDAVSRYHGHDPNLSTLMWARHGTGTTEMKTLTS